MSKTIILRNNIAGEILTRMSKSIILINNIEARMSKTIILRNNILSLGLVPTQLIPSLKDLRLWAGRLVRRNDRQSVQEEFAREEADMMDKAERKRNNKNKWVSRLGY
jgi:hypothetical protein